MSLGGKQLKRSPSGCNDHDCVGQQRVGLQGAGGHLSAWPSEAGREDRAIHLLVALRAGITSRTARAVASIVVAPLTQRGKRPGTPGFQLAVPGSGFFEAPV